MNSIERRLLRLEHLHGPAADTDAILAGMTDLELADVILAINQLIIDCPIMLDDDRQQTIQEMPYFVEQWKQALYWSKWDRRRSRPIDQLLRRLFPGFQPPGGERVAA